MTRIALLSLLALSWTTAEYDGFSMLEVEAETDAGRRQLHSVIEAVEKLDKDDEIEVLNAPQIGPSQFLVSPKKRKWLETRLRGLKTAVKVADMGHEIEEERAENAIIVDMERMERQYRSGREPDLEDYFNRHHSFAEMEAFLKKLEAQSGGAMRLFSIGKSIEGRDLWVANFRPYQTGNPALGNGSIDLRESPDYSGPKRPAFWVDAGIHAREWGAITTGMWFVYHLSKYRLGQAPRSTEDAIRNHYVESLDFYIMPLMNPDGYEASRTQSRLWRKNAREVCSKSWGKIRCKKQGVDLNRNWGFKWGTGGESAASSRPTQEHYKGTKAFSEPESQATSDFLRRLKAEKDLGAYITLHTYGQLWMYPFGYAKRVYTPNHAELMEVAKNATAALKELYGTKYRTGSPTDILYAATGASDDWAAGELKVRFVFCLELRTRGSFKLPLDEIVPTGKETWAGIEVVADALLGHKEAKPVIFPTTESTTTSLAPSTTSPSTTTTSATTPKTRRTRKTTTAPRKVIEATTKRLKMIIEPSPEELGIEDKLILPVKMTTRRPRKIPPQIVVKKKPCENRSWLCWSWRKYCFIYDEKPLDERTRLYKGLQDRTRDKCAKACGLC